MSGQTTEKIQVQVDQEDDAPEIESPTMDATPEPQFEDSGAFYSTAELPENEIRDSKGRRISIPNQPAGVFAAISRKANEFIDVVMGVLDKSQLAALTVLQEGAESFGAEGEVADQVESDAVSTIIKKTIPAILGILAQDAPEFLSEIVAMIIEPEPKKIRRGADLTYSPEDVLWEFPVDQQVKAVCCYIDSLNLEALKKKLTKLRG